MAAGNRSPTIAKKTPLMKEFLRPPMSELHQTMQILHATDHANPTRDSL